MEKEDQVRTLHIDKFMGTGTLHPRVWGSWLRSLRGQLFLKGHGGRKRFLKKVGKQMALRFSTRVSREIWGPCQKAVETDWKAWNSTWTQGNTAEQVAQRQREVSIRGDNQNPTGDLAGRPALPDPAWAGRSDRMITEVCLLSKGRNFCFLCI